MKRILFISILVTFISVFLVVYVNSRKVEIEIRTQSVFREYVYNSVGKLNPTQNIVCPKDDFVEVVLVRLFEDVKINDEILHFESKEEEYELAKARSEYAVSLLKEGEAVQAEKKLALEVAGNNLGKTVVKSPSDGYLVALNVKNGSYVSKGSIIATIIPYGFKMLVEIPDEIAGMLDSIESVELTVQRIGISVMIDYEMLETHDSKLFFAVKSEKIDFDRLLPEEIVRIKAIERMKSVVWIPANFVENGTVETENGRVPVSVIKEESGMYLIKGLKDGDRIFGQR